MNLDKFTACILAVAIGDALGMPFEKMTISEINAVLDKDGDGKFLPISVNPKPFSTLKGLQPGFWTDDTQLTLAIVRALIESGGKMDMQLIANWHVKAFNEERRGWGRTTTRACERLNDGVAWQKSGEAGWGNGVMMKISPIALWQSIKQKPDIDFINICLELAMMTHTLRMPMVAGFIHARAIERLARVERASDFSATEWLDDLYERAKYLESLLIDDGSAKISDQLACLKHLHLNSGGLLKNMSSSVLGACFGSDTRAAFSAFNSLGLSYAMFMNDTHYFNSVFNMIRAAGDTDSNTAIVASLLGALHGQGIIPAHLVAQVEK